MATFCFFVDYIMGGIIEKMLPELGKNDIVRLRKPHPCGSYDWQVVRLGADIGLVCCQCGRKVMLSRRELLKRLKKIVEKGDMELKDND